MNLHVFKYILYKIYTFKNKKKQEQEEIFHVNKK